MKKICKCLIPMLCGIVAGILISSALYATTGFSLFGEPPDRLPSYADVDNARLAEFAFDILELIKERDYAAISRLAHPEYGVVFSPCATVSFATNKRFSARQMAAFGDDKNIYVWGINSIGGDPIEMTPSDYFARYVFDRDYTSAAAVGLNHIVRSGNALENITEAFPDALFVDFHIPGVEKDASEEPEWSSLRLGFEEYNGTLRLTLILHSERTV